MKNCLHELSLSRIPRVGDRVQTSARGRVEYGRVQNIQGYYCTVVLDSDGSEIELYPSEMQLA